MPGSSAPDEVPWRDLTDPRRAVDVDDVEAGLKAPEFENLEIPEAFGPVRELVDDHKIKRYAFTQDDHLDWALIGGSPFGPGRIGHAGLLANDLLQLFTLRYAASDVVGLHTEEQLWFDSPVRLGETVRLEGRYVDAYVQRGQGMVVMEAEATGEDGRSILRHRGVEILRTVPGDIAGRAAAEPTRRVTGEVPSTARIVRRLSTDAQVGDALEPLPKAITVEQAAVFSRIGEYVTTTHTSLPIARAAGLRVPIVQGQQLVGVLTQLLTRAFGAAFFTSGWLRVKFIAPVFVHDAITAEGIVTSVTSDGADTTIELEIWIRRPDGRLAVAGWASGRLQDGPDALDITTDRPHG